jgi:hypothetical protein
MTEKELIGHIKMTNRFPKTFDDYLNYAFFIFPIAFIVMGYSMIYNYFKFDSGLAMLFISLLLIFLSVCLGFLIYTRLNDNIRFVTISTNSQTNIDNIADTLSQNFKLRRIDVNKDLNRILAFTKATGFSWGEQLTLILDTDKVLINSRPGGARQPLTIIKDRQNIKKLKLLLQ